MARGKLEILGEGPDLLGLDLDAGDAVHQHQGGIGGHQRGLGVVDEDVEAGRVQQVDLELLPLDEGQRGGDGDLALDLFVVEVGDGVALIDAGEAVGGARQEEDPGGERRFARIPVSDQSDVANILAFVNLHRGGGGGASAPRRGGRGGPGVAPAKCARN